jgi:hypothetical protein
MASGGRVVFKVRRSRGSTFVRENFPHLVVVLQPCWSAHAAVVRTAAQASSRLRPRARTGERESWEISNNTEYTALAKPFVARDATSRRRFIQCFCLFPKIRGTEAGGVCEGMGGTTKAQERHAWGERPCFQSSSDQCEGPGGGLAVLVAGERSTNASTADSSGSARRGLHSSTADSCGSALLWLHCKLQSTAASSSPVARATMESLISAKKTSTWSRHQAVFAQKKTRHQVPQKIRGSWRRVTAFQNQIWTLRPLRPQEFLGAQTFMITMRTLIALAVALAAPRPAATFAPSLLQSARAGGAPLPQARHAAARSISSSPVLRMSGGGYVGDAKLKDLGIVLPTVAAAAANYVRTTPRHARV